MAMGYSNAMKALFSVGLACVFMMNGVNCIAGPITRIASISPRYNSDVIEIHWVNSLVGGCNTSDFAVTNAGAANSNELKAFLLVAFSAGFDVEVIFGGGCDGTSNWIQTVRLIQ